MPAVLALAAAPAAADRYAGVVEEILALWRQADFVCLGEDHGRKHDSDLRIALVGHPQFHRTVDVVVVEFANPLHQDLLDRFVVGGEEVPSEELARVWRDTSAPRVWDSPVYADFLRAMRRANLRVGPDERVRVVGAAVAIDWERARRGEELLPLLGRGGALAAVAERETFGAGRKGLGIYGAGHCERRRGFLGGLDARYPGRARAVFSFYGAEGAAAGRGALGLGAAPQLIAVRGTERADLPAGRMFPTGSTADPSLLGEVVDAIVYHGDVDEVVVEPDSAIYRGAYLEELDRRRALHEEFVELARRRLTGGTAEE